MTESEAKAAFETLAKKSLEIIQGAREGLEPYHRGMAHYDSERDKRFTELSSFSEAVTVLAALPLVQGVCRSEDLNRLSLQFIYVFCDELRRPLFDAGAFETVWTAFWGEILQTDWVDIGVAHIQNFQSPAPVLDLEDGISIRRRTHEALKSFLGTADWLVAHLDEDSGQGVWGTHVLVVTSMTPKTAANFNSVGDPSLQTKARRALLAMRLFKSGDARIGRMFLGRRVRFDSHVRAIQSLGLSVWHPGPTFNLEPSEVPSVVSMYNLLAGFEAARGQELRNVELALRSFTSIYERIWPQAEDKIVDAVIALEALLGEETEIAFKLAFRTSGLLARDDNERVALFNRMKSYYDTRSKIVHGTPLKEKQLRVVQNPEDLIGIVRQLLVAFLHLIESGSLPTTEFRGNIDAALQHSQQRDELRKRMGLA